MSQENTITLRGFVTAEPKLWQPTPTHTPVTEIRVGSPPRRLNRATGEWEDGDTSYYTVKCWRRLAVNVKGSLRKGDMVIIRGKFVTRTWVDDQQRTRMQLQVEADSVGHDLAYGWSNFNRGAQTGWNEARRQADGEVARQDLDAMVDAQGDGDERDEADALRDSELTDPGMTDPGMANAGMANAGMANAGIADPGVADSGVADPEMSDDDFEKLAAGIGAQAETAPTY
jgi:single-strand DNA-binding protein